MYIFVSDKHINKDRERYRHTYIHVNVYISKYIYAYIWIYNFHFYTSIIFVARIRFHSRHPWAPKGRPKLRRPTAPLLEVATLALSWAEEVHGGSISGWSWYNPIVFYRGCEFWFHLLEVLWVFWEGISVWCGFMILDICG